MKCQRIRLIISLVTLLTLCLTLSSVPVRAEGEDDLFVTAEIEDVGGKLPEETSFLITLARADETDTVSPLPDKTETTLKPGETDEFRFHRADFTEPGDYCYTMKQEKAAGDDNVITEEVTYQITVRVVNGNSGLNATVDIRKEGQNDKFESVVFHNNDKRAANAHGNQGNTNQNQSDTSDAPVAPPITGEAFPCWVPGLMGLSGLLGAWSIGRHVMTASAGKGGNES